MHRALNSLAPALALAAIAGLAAIPASAGAQGAAQAKQPDFPPFESVAGELDKIVSTTDGAKPLYTLYADLEDGKLLAELPPNYESQLVMIAPTVSGGDDQAGVMGGTIYGKWKKIGKSLALVQPDFSVSTDAGDEAKESIEQLYTGTVIVDLPIVTTGPGGGPVIDLAMMMTAKFNSFFPTSPVGYGPWVPGANPRLASITKAKAFPENVVAEVEMPRGDGKLVRLTYDIGLLEGTQGFTPRKADNRVGYFYNWHMDFAEPRAEDVPKRYITRWHIEKADPALSMSPPKEPIVWYIEHTTPIKYRRYVRDGILAWNKAFEEIGITGALEVYQQDARTGAHMDVDPEDARYNFFRWNTTNQGYAIGPSRTNPTTGEILDADVVWHQGLTRTVWNMLGSLSETALAENLTGEALAYFSDNPKFDPRVRLREPAAQAELLARHAAGETLFVPSAAKKTGSADNHMTHACNMGSNLAMNFGLAAAALDADLLKSEDGADLIDGLPEEFMGQMIRYITTHEVGHCIGLQHNFAASTIRSLKELNAPGYDGPLSNSVMEYCAVNINTDDDLEQGNYALVGVGPYDKWAIAFGYGPEDQRDAVLARAAEPDLRFGSQIATQGPDPRVNTWDLGADPLEFSKSRMKIVRDLRKKLTDDLVKDGESWAKARARYDQLLFSTHLSSLLYASQYIGGSYVNPFNKGDANAPLPIETVPAAKQREALAFMIDNTFESDAYGLTPEMMKRFGVEYWWDPAGIGSLFQDPAYAVHNAIAGMQAAALSLVMNPTTIRRLHDNEFRDGDKAFTLAETMTTLTDEAWSELKGSKRSVEIDSLRRSLQDAYTERLVALALDDSMSAPAMRTASTLAVAELDRVKAMIDGASSSDPYTKAHLADVARRIQRATEAAYVVPR